MKKLYTIGEMLIDFTANKIGSLKEVKEFVKNPGGAPAMEFHLHLKINLRKVYDKT